MIRKLLVVSALLTAVLAPIGIAAASTVDGEGSIDDAVETEAPIQQVNPDCDGTCDGRGIGAQSRSGSGPLHEGPVDGTGNRFGQSGGHGNGRGATARLGVGIGPRDGTGPIHVGPADGTGNRYGVANGLRNPDDGMECDGTRRHAPNAVDSSS
jgi:hypothetical protein